MHHPKICRGKPESNSCWNKESYASLDSKGGDKSIEIKPNPNSHFQRNFDYNSSFRSEESFKSFVPWKITFCWIWRSEHVQVRCEKSTSEKICVEEGEQKLEENEDEVMA